MSNANPNFVSELVQMAKAFEELPIVKHELDDARVTIDAQQSTIQRLELRLLDRANEIDSLNATVRKVEVERDHAERMFLETDDRLNAFRRLVQAFDTDVKSLVKAEEPEKASAPAVSEATLPSVDPVIDPGRAIGDAFTLPPQEVNETQPQGQGDTTPTVPSSTTSGGEPTGETSQPLAEGVSVSADPIPTAPSTEATPASADTAPITSDTVQSSSASEGQRDVDPTASSTAGDGHSPENASEPTTAATIADASGQGPSGTTASSEATPVDDVGYHNEPKIVGTGAEAWAEWDKWCERMNKRYPHSVGGWPSRPMFYGDREAAAQ